MSIEKVVAAIEVGTLWLPRWLAALAVLALLALLAAVLVAVARARLRRLESPAATVRRRAGEYQEWWESRIAPPPVARRTEAAESGPAGAEDAGSG